MEKNYLRAVTQGTWWNYVQYVFSVVTSFVLSIILTRYFATSIYGVYTYVYFVINTLVVTLNFGLTTTLQTYIPPLHFGDQLDERNRTFRQLLKIQLAIIGLSFLVLLPLVTSWQHITSFHLQNFALLILVAIVLSGVNVIINFFATLFGSLQRFRLLSLVNIFSQTLSFLAAILMVVLHQQLLFILLFTLAINLAVLGRYIWLSREMIGGARAVVRQPVELRKMLGFSYLAYINILLQLVIWDRSEFFFLGKLQASYQLAIYGISYTIALMATGLIDPIMNVFVSVLSELVGKNDWDRIRLIIDKSSKYVGMVFLPIVTILLFYGPYLITFVYGHRFLSVSIIAPWLTLSALMARAFIPAWAITTYKHDLRSIIKIELGVAGLNVLLDILLIRHYGFIGAAWANTLTQIAALLALMLFVRKYGLRLFRSSFVQIMILNAVVATVLVVLRRMVTGWGFHLVFLGAAVTYIVMLATFFIHADDLLFMEDMQAHSPAFLRPILALIVNILRSAKLRAEHA